MLRTTLTTLALGLALSTTALAETHEVKMLNKGAEGKMIFEPSFLQIAVGDSVLFLPTDKGHNAESIEGMMPEGAESFKGKMNKEVEATFDVEGVYGIMCKPHYAMGMVMTIEVGDADATPDDFFEGRVPKKAKERFEEQLGKL
ncbi:pseudoazurin [Sulfitobacter sp. F26204]|uniref:pseudoazurin n=1 Tax=Sulfitobacter sp. F26204 TaxID=2996014 RepID=UPI00225E3EA4|nr:pseudoazurin [Sulfitobacter sp. F26204]MCX7560175.1 pseudoazurin [Sulfitobacter sp. F26204]